MSIIKKYVKKVNGKAGDVEKENYKVSQQITNIGSWTRDLVNDEIYFSDNFYEILECNPDDLDCLEKYYLLVTTTNLL